MKPSKSILTPMIGLFLLVAVTSCNEKNKESKQTKTILPTISKEELENEAWQMEENYWDYVQKIDTIAYKNLWHNEFIGYPSFGDGVSNKSKIAIWIPELHKDPNLKFSYKLYRKAANAIDDVVIVFYDADEIWTDKENNIVRKETFKFTHTWKKYNDDWVILGGMAAKKNQDILND
ncbi:MAG: nuclear transport factor 2 family protein [Flammeovirgaceae bacterium]|nr:nuclear transport factor 2 family protein [Flammeovirgaceae bacterium]